MLRGTGFQPVTGRLRREGHAVSRITQRTKPCAMAVLVLVLAGLGSAGCAIAGPVQVDSFPKRHDAVRWIYGGGSRIIAGVLWTGLPYFGPTGNQIQHVRRGPGNTVLFEECPYVPGETSMLGDAPRTIALDLKTGKPVAPPPSDAAPEQPPASPLTQSSRDAPRISSCQAETASWVPPSRSPARPKGGLRGSSPCTDRCARPCRSWIMTCFLW